jgi:DNA recombination protein Rad52
MKTDLQKQLDENIPEDVISTRQGSGGRTLDYLETWYVIDRLNQVLGQGNWSYTSEVTCVHNGSVKTQSGETNSVHYIARVRLVVLFGEQSSEFTDYGYGDGTDKNNSGKAHELAVKEAVSDGLKRCAKNLGRSMGLALYDKTQEFVGKTELENKEVPVIKEVQSSQPSKFTKQIILASFKVLEAQGKITGSEFKMKYQNNRGIGQLTEEELEKCFNNVKTDYPELKL